MRLYSFGLSTSYRVAKHNSMSEADVVSAPLQISFLVVPLSGMMTTVISGTNRKNSRTLKVAQYYLEHLKAYTSDAHLLSLEDMDILCRSERLQQVEQELLIPSGKFIFVMPEYNGSFPGVLKLLFDQSDIQRCWWYKKALLVGLADGRGGNLRGIDHMTGILHYLKMNIFYNTMPLSKIREELDETGQFRKETTIKAVEDQIRAFADY